MSRRGGRRCATRNERRNTPIDCSRQLLHYTYTVHSYLYLLLLCNINRLDSNQIDESSRVGEGNEDRSSDSQSTRAHGAHTPSRSRSHTAQHRPNSASQRASALCWRLGWTHRQPTPATRNADALFAHQLARHSAIAIAMHFVPQTHSRALGALQLTVQCGPTTRAAGGSGSVWSQLVVMRSRCVHC